MATIIIVTNKQLNWQLFHSKKCFIAFLASPVLIYVTNHRPTFLLVLFFK